VSANNKHSPDDDPCPHRCERVRRLVCHEWPRMCFQCHELHKLLKGYPQMNKRLADRLELEIAAGVEREALAKAQEEQG
jgi:hypothetical protein